MKICLHNCHFGKLPPWTKFFAKSASKTSVDFYISSDDPDVPMYNDFCRDNNISNVNFAFYFVEELVDHVSEELLSNYSMPSIRKICDWKTAYNFLFKEYTDRYDYWGHCDLDIIVGDLDSYLNPLLGKFDIISGDTNRLCGPFNIYKTSLGDVFKMHKLWAQIMRMDHVSYDEVGLDMAVKQSDLKVCYGVDSDGRKMQNYGSPHLEPPLRIPATWSDGKLTIDEDGRETMFIHMGHKNQITDTKFYNQNFKINQRGFSYE